MNLVNRIDRQRPDAPDLAARGPHDVGVRTLEMIDAGRLDVVSADGDTIPRYDRPFSVEIWYPATPDARSSDPEGYATITRGGTPTTLNGRARRDAVPERQGAPWPLIIASHGYPGNRYTLAHLGEHLASVGYVVAAIDHSDSTYGDEAAFGSTLLNRPLDQRFVLDELDRRAAADGPLSGLLDTSRTGLLAYSMGAYGALTLLGAGIEPFVVDGPYAPPGRALAPLVRGHPGREFGPDPRIRALVAAAPWGMAGGMWGAEGLAGLRTPTLFVAGSHDDVSGYEDGIAAVYRGAVNAERWLLTFENARHNVAGIPPPTESEHDGSYGHYADPVWDAVKLNNVLQHFARAFLGRYVRGEADLGRYLDLPERASDAWLGFPERSALGMTLHHAAAGSTA